MNLKELLQTDFGKKLPISGGFGNSIENAIVIHKQDVIDYVGLEYFVLSCLGIGRQIEWKKLGQELVVFDDKKIDKITIETRNETISEVITQEENYYFDITEFFEGDNRKDNLFDENETILEIKSRIEELAEINDLNKKCVDLLKKEKLFNDSDLLLKFIDVLLQDQSRYLFDSMMKHKKKSLTVVLRIVAEQFRKS
jgi:hypothetical protein